MHERDITETTQHATPAYRPSTDRPPKPAVPGPSRTRPPPPSQRERVELSMLLCPDSEEQEL